VAPLIIEAAQAAREEARRVRNQSVELRIALHWSAQVAEAKTRQAAAAAAAARARCEFPLESPWSSLLWLREDASLERTLVPLD
jgi:hypothetical protein